LPGNPVGIAFGLRGRDLQMDPETIDSEYAKLVRR
jgi:hypothetical protein